MGNKHYHSWFPVANAQMMDTNDFHSLTTTEKLYYWLLVSEYNRGISENGEFYRSDQWFASALNASDRTIKEARKKCKKLGFIDITPGFRSNGRPVATTYKYVKWADPSEITDGYMRQQRHTFESLLDKVRREKLAIGDIVVYICLNYFRDKASFKNQSDEFYVGKKDFRKRVGFNKVDQSVKNLYDNFVFSGGSHLFEYTAGYHKISFSNWTEAAEPQENDGAYESSQRYRSHIEARVKAAKAEKEQKERQKAREKGVIYSADDLLDYFREKYTEFHGKSPHIERTYGVELLDLGKKHPPEEIGELIAYYFHIEEERVPRYTKARLRTLKNFMEAYEDLRKLKQKSE